MHNESRNDGSLYPRTSTETRCWKYGSQLIAASIAVWHGCERITSLLFAIRPGGMGENDTAVAIEYSDAHRASLFEPNIMTAGYTQARKFERREKKRGSWVRRSKNEDLSPREGYVD